MIGFNHAMAGVIIAATVPAPLVPFVALVSHFVMDALPHFGKSEVFKPYTKPFKWLLGFDALLCFLVLGGAFLLFPDTWWLMIVGTLFATLPDFLWLFERTKIAKNSFAKKYFWFAKKIQWGETPDGWTYEIIYFALLFVALAYVA